MSPLLPPGFTHNPSSLQLRRWLVGLACAGLAVATFLTLVQLRVIGSWDPVFGTTEDVLHSWVSELFPVPDALLGALIYLSEVVLGSIGGADRWRTHPWVVLAFEAALLATATAGIALTLVQAFVLHTYCLLCLVQAAIGVTLLTVSRLQEARAALAQLRRLRR
ncbi:vitamin K epoxide reductase family protein [Isoptericola sp. b441]|uniref:Vitamin K epoxide reductase family protein n=1 Tax=Actinotalea lenta TaxID=3064654 RepID=A0ABT9DAR7_9CELL|nr:MULTISPECIES: vitamin K epoxide reductase family protein [unclassified Isoptericola]MDO8107243.1 vitamin K epoxide reductase family protein [Isoptericola sp. b441]MDO8121094.1 vitamin K epoxide reductase family protein [Isoptericola sp. b490]